MLSDSIWITGPTRSGKTTRLVAQFCQWVQGKRRIKARASASLQGSQSRSIPEILVFAANDDNRRDLADRLAAASAGRYPVVSKTPLGFFQDEVMLFWPLLIQQLNLRAQFPLRLRPESEQELATQLWRPELDKRNLQMTGVSEYRFVRRILDLLQLAATSGTPAEEIPGILKQGIHEQENFAQGNQEGSPDWNWIGELLLGWRSWCLERGLLSYGIICELYWRHLLPNPTYQQHLRHRYQAVLADDVDDYPAIARNLFDLLLDKGAVGAFTYNLDGAVRLGLNADPQYLQGISARCRVETLSQPSVTCLRYALGQSVVQLASDPNFFTNLPASVQSLQTTSRSQLLRQTAEAIIAAVRRGEVQPQEIAVIAPGLDAIARYTLTEIFRSQEIPVESLNDQHPLIASPVIRALLTLLALVYPGLGRLVDRDAVAEMLVVLSTRQEGNGAEEQKSLRSDIDPVRAGLLADYCYAPDPEQPRLLPVAAFPRWDRLGHSATSAYEGILRWLEAQRSQQEVRLIPSAIALLDRAIQQFLWNGSNLPYDQLAALRELMETAQHFWEVDGRLRQGEQIDTPAHTTIAQFILLLRKGTITANPYPVRRLDPTSRAVTLATIFQYRSSRRFHRWQFWLDAGSPLWLSGGAATLFGAELFLKDWSGFPWTEEDKQNEDEQRLRRILRDLLGRAGERLYLCHSELAVNGQEQTGPLLSLVNASMPLVSESTLTLPRQEAQPITPS
ncbi:MAG: recombinase family protein [Aphanothece sp. CMT-3BRIN-NPC111]|nr:recombinase family protein [Aphanothece sp. CMT-3BRIN-NPC111]